MALNKVFSSLVGKKVYLSGAMSGLKGLPEGGVGAQSRHSNTAAKTGIGPDKGHGSAWRGIMMVGKNISMHIFGGLLEGFTTPVTQRGMRVSKRVAGDTDASPLVIADIVKKLRPIMHGVEKQELRKLVHELRIAKRQGFDTVSLIRGDLFRDDPAIKLALETIGVNQWKHLKAIIRHERIHQSRIQSGAWGKSELPTTLFGKSKVPIFTDVLVSVGYGSNHKNIYEETLAFAASESKEPGMIKKLTQMLDAPDFTDELIHIEIPSMRQVAKDLSSNRMHTNMQRATDQVKGNTNIHTTPGLARSPHVGGSRKMPNTT